MKFTPAILALALLSSSSIAFGQADVGKVHLLSGQTLTGKFTELTRDKVIVVQPPGAPKQYAINEVKFIQLPGEPKDLMDARHAALRGQYDLVLQTIAKIPNTEMKNEKARQEVEFYRLFATARLAEAGKGDPTPAGRGLLSYIAANKDSHHYYDANEAAGDLLVAMQRYEQAVPYYNKVGGAPWPDAKMRAAVAIARSLQAQNKHDEAIVKFDETAAVDAKGQAAELLILSARTGKAKSFVAGGKTDEGVKMLNDIIDETPVENMAALALANNALGDAYNKLGKSKDALYAFLRTHLLYNQSPDLHAEALYNLKELWTKDNHPDRAKEAAELLKTKYASSRWNK